MEKISSKSFGRLQIVTGPSFYCQCLRCKKNLYHPEDEVFADLEGEPFKAYYCEECSRVLQQDEKPSRD